MTTPLAYSLTGAVTATGMSRATLERAIRAGRLRAKKSSQDENGEPTGSWVIPAASLQAYIDGLVDA
jgi:hypothetical protein